jgi:MoaA/NifB/PqqE/SkfB family radical SAM enzyme
MAAYPQYLQIEPTTRCNFTCGFCAGRHMPQQDMPLEHLQKLVDSLEHLTHVELQGEGEPLLHPDFFAMVAYLRQKFPAVKISLITNGSLFTESVIEQLLQASLSSIMVSLESADEAEFQRIRGGKFSRVTRGLRKLMERKKAAHGAAPCVGFAVTVLHSTLPQITTIAQLYDELGLDGGIMLQPLQTMQIYRQFYDADMLGNLLQKADHQYIQQLIATDLPLRRSLTEHQRQSNFYRELYATETGSEPSCPWLERGLFISASGAAASCCFIKDAAQYALGPTGGSISTVIETRQKLLQRLKRGEIPTQCQGCGVAGKMQKHYGVRTAVAVP